MGKNFVIGNVRSLKGHATTAVPVTRKSWEALLHAMELPYYKYKDTYLDEAIANLTYEERITQSEWVECAKPSFSHQNKGRRHKLYGVTNAVLEVFIYLHKKCNTNGVIRNATTHLLWENYKTYKEGLAFIGHSQFYIALEKLRLHRIIEVEKNWYGRTTIKFPHFKNEETGKANFFTYVSPVVFTKEFFQLSVAAKKLFLDISMQQTSPRTFRRSLERFDEGGNSTYMGGMYRLLHKKFPHQIQEVIEELSTPLKCTGTPLFSICKMEKGNKNKRKYTTLSLSLHTDIICTKEGEATVYYRDPLQPKQTYQRKARFIMQVLEELNIGEFSKEIDQFIHLLKHVSHRQIREVLRGLRALIDRQEGYPTKLIYTIKKLLNQASQYRVMDLAAKEGLYPLITQHLPPEKQEQALFDFSTQFATDSIQRLRILFKRASALLKNTYAVPVSQASYHRHYIKYQEERLFRDYAYNQGVSIDAYLTLEVKVRELLKSRGHKKPYIPSDIREFFIEQIDRLPQEKMRVIEPPRDFCLVPFLRSLEKLMSCGKEVQGADQVIAASL